jgi:glycerol kinase
MQFQADVLGAPVVVSALAETTALGAALLAGVGAAAWTVDDLRAGAAALGGGERRRFQPRMGEDERAGLLAGWADAVARTRSFA